MISRLKGKLISVIAQKALVDNQGISYEVQLPSALADKLAGNGYKDTDVTFDTIYYIEAGDRKSNHFPRLVGFTDPIDREFFSLFTQVPGLGVKKALKSLILPINEIATAIENKDAGRLSKLPGVGARLAEKIIAELHGKTAKYALSKSDEPLASVTKSNKTPLADEAMLVLTQLGYSEQEADKMIELGVKANPKLSRVEDLITEIFKAEQSGAMLK